MHCNESIKENHRQRYRTLLNAIYFNSTHFNKNHYHTGGNNTFQYGRAAHRSKTTSNYFNMDNQQTGRTTICPISHYKETSRTTTTNRIKRAHAANKTLLLQLYTLQQLPYKRPYRITDTRKQMKSTLCTSQIGGVGSKTNHLDCNHTAYSVSTRADFSKVIQPLKKTPLADERTCSTYQIRQATK